MKTISNSLSSAASRFNLLNFTWCSYQILSLSLLTCLCNFMLWKFFVRLNFRKRRSFTSWLKRHFLSLLFLYSLLISLVFVTAGDPKAFLVHMMLRKKLQWIHLTIMVRAVVFFYHDDFYSLSFNMHFKTFILTESQVLFIKACAVQ